MFKDKTMARNNDSDASVTNTIKNGTEISGDIVCKGDIRIEGKLVGNLKTEGKLVVGQSGVIEGNVECTNADISGGVKVNIQVDQLLVLTSTANLVGEIVTQKLQIEPGANFSGSCKMGAVIKGIDENSRNEKLEKSA